MQGRDEGGKIRYPGNSGAAVPMVMGSASLAGADPGRNARSRDLLIRMFQSAIASADPEKILSRYLPEPPCGRCVVVGAGKAAAAMAKAVEAAWADRPLTGVVVVPYGHALPSGRVRILEAAHPVPDRASEDAAKQMLRIVAGLTSADLVLALISGGGSATLALPAPGLTLADKQEAYRVLLHSGLDIRTMNAVRRRLSGIKGGRLAEAAHPARLVTLGISDIPGDDPYAIASGPTLPDRDEIIDLEPVLTPIGHLLPPPVLAALRRRPVPLAHAAASDFRMIATPGRALDAAASLARVEGFEVVILGDDIEGEARVVGTRMRELVAGVARPTVFLSGGETTVTIGSRPPGRGGRNTEFILALAIALQGDRNVWALAGDTDGEDGVSGCAGAIVDGSTLERTSGLGVDVDRVLDDHDSASLFDALGDLVITGPTRTNVNDFRAIIVYPES